MKDGLRREDAHCCQKWSVSVKKITAGGGESGHPHLLWILPYLKHWCLSLKQKFHIQEFKRTMFITAIEHTVITYIH